MVRPPAPSAAENHGPGKPPRPLSLLLAHVEEHEANLVPLVPALSRRLPELPDSKATDADTERFLLFAAVVGMILLAALVGGYILSQERLSLPGWVRMA